jgi:hypothetical protein
MHKITRLILLTAVLGFAITPAPAQTPTPAQPTPTPTLRDKITQVLPDRRVTFRLLAPKANAVDVIIGIKSGPYEPQGSTTVAIDEGRERSLERDFGPLRGEPLRVPIQPGWA